LGSATVDDCLEGDANFDEQIIVDEIVSATSRALSGYGVDVPF
jgi:hypothetical protein